MEKFKQSVHVQTRTPYDTNNESKVSHQSKSSKTNTLSQEIHINSNLEWFIEALPHLEPIHYVFHLVGKHNSRCCLCSCVPCLTPWWTKFNIAFDKEDFHRNTLYNYYGILQHSQAESDDCHLCLPQALSQWNLANQAADPPRAITENLEKFLNQVDDVNGDNDSSSKLVHQANTAGNAKVIKADDANVANNNNTHANVAKDSAANVAIKWPHPPLQWTWPWQNLANQAADPPRDVAENIEKSFTQVDHVNCDNNLMSKSVQKRWQCW